MWPSGELYSPGSDDWPVWTLPAPLGTNVSVSPVITVTHQFRLGLAGWRGSHQFLININFRVSDLSLSADVSSIYVTFLHGYVNSL